MVKRSYMSSIVEFQLNNQLLILICAIQALDITFFESKQFRYFGKEVCSNQLFNKYQDLVYFRTFLEKDSLKSLTLRLSIILEQYIIGSNLSLFSILIFKNYLRRFNFIYSKWILKSVKIRDFTNFNTDKVMNDKVINTFAIYGLFLLLGI